MSIVLHDKTFVSTLIDMPASHLLSIFKPPPHVPDRQAHHEAGQFPVSLGPQKQMPMIGHYAKCQYPHRRLSLRFDQTSLKRLEILA